MVRPQLILLGYWSTGPESPLPAPDQFIDSEWDADERDLVVDFLHRGFVARSYMGYSPCRCCGQPNGALELSDGVYVWPDGYAHYLTDHGVKPPQEFVDHVLSTLSALEIAERNEEWWSTRPQ